MSHRHYNLSGDSDEGESVSGDCQDMSWAVEAVAGLVHRLKQLNLCFGKG